jgi:predicted tellurium resistance membrane protein TerC
MMLNIHDILPTHLCSTCFLFHYLDGAMPKADGVRRATPLLLVLACVELSDLAFSVASTPVSPPHR